jgi:hypothetical protein
MSANEEFARQLADMADEQAKAIADGFSVELDYTRESLDRLDELISRPEFAAAQSESMITGLGVYVGETIRRNLGARWVEDSEFRVHLREVGGFNMMSLPVKWVTKRVENGATESIAGKYRALVTHVEGGAKAGEGTAAFIGGPAASDAPGDEIEEILIQAPAVIFFVTAAADDHVDDAEWDRFLRIMSDYNDYQSELFHRAVNAMRPRINQYFAYLSSPEFDAQESLEQISSTLDENYGETEARQFKTTLLDLGKKIAEASGGFLGFGEKISEEEITALTNVAETLGIAAEESE